MLWKEKAQEENGMESQSKNRVNCPPKLNVFYYTLDFSQQYSVTSINWRKSGSRLGMATPFLKVGNLHKISW